MTRGKNSPRGCPVRCDGGRDLLSSSGGEVDSTQIDPELSLMVDLFNVTNNQFVTERRESDTSSFGVATDWQDAGSIVFGAKYSF